MMKNRKTDKSDIQDTSLRDTEVLNTNEVMHDYEFYLKMYSGEHRMDFESAKNEF